MTNFVLVNCFFIAPFENILILAKKHTMSKRKQNPKDSKKSKESDNPKKEVHQPDDKLFKVVMEKKENAAQYLMTCYPEFAAIIDLDSLEISREKFSIPNLKVFDADISYRGKFKDSDEVFHVNYLWENKSEPEEHVAIQIGLYLFLRYYKMVKTKGQKLEPIIPLIFYNGKRDWIPKTVTQLFEGHAFFGIFEKFLPNFDFHFTNITKFPKAELLKIERAFFRSAMVAMASKHNFDLFFQDFSVIFDLDEEDELITIGHYVFAIYERLPEEIRKASFSLPEPVKIKFMSTLDIINRRAADKVTTEFIVKMHNKNLSSKEIAKLLDLDEQFVIDTIKSQKK